MDDMISRKAAKEAIRNKIVSASTVVRMWDILDSVPAVDVVQMVRCRDCKYSDVIYDTTLDTMPLKCLNIRYGGVMPDWYCEHGERRDSE